MLELARDGADLHAGVATVALPMLHEWAGLLPQGQAGVRVAGAHAALVRPLLATDGCIGRIAAGVLGGGSRPVRAILFDKSSALNWALDWHQDRTICVRECHAVPGFGPWTRKQGLAHVAPPMAIIEAMVTLRVHLDDVQHSNAPLLVALGSHRAGRVAEDRIADVVAAGWIHACAARAGDVWRYATPILHASAAAERPTRRRVLQVDFAAADLPGGLEWAGV